MGGMDLGRMGVLVLVAGIALAAVGGILVLAGQLGLGNLPGDISVKGRRGSFYFPIVSCLIVSVVLTVVLNLIARR